MPAKALLLGRPVYRGYIPIDLPQHRPRYRAKPWLKIDGKPRLAVHPRQEPEEWAAVAEYPPINDATPEGLRRQPRLDWYEQIKALPSVEQKLHEINRHCSHYMAHINNHICVHQGLPLVKYLTRTHFIDGLPSTYGLNKLESDETSSVDILGSSITDTAQSEQISRIKQLLLDQIALEKYESRKLDYDYISYSGRGSPYNQYVQDSLVRNLVQSLRRALAPDLNQQLLNYQIDQSPAIRSWWYHSGFKAPNKKIFYKSRKDKDGNISQIIQCDGRSALNFRSDSFIEPQLDLNDELVTNTALIQEQSHLLKYYRAIYKFKYPVALPGFWFEQTPKYDCPHTCFLTFDALEMRNRMFHNHAVPLRDEEDALNCQAILTAFSWLNSLSMYHGYTPFQEIDYPFTCQVITTDGQNWLFNVYQMNTHSFHRDFGGPQRNNICWSSGLMRLYDEYKGNGDFIGINERVLELILKFFAQQTSPSYTQSLSLRPYLGNDTRSDAEKDYTLYKLRRSLENRSNDWLKKEWQVPMFEHIFFRSPELRHQIKHMKARWHIPKPKFPKIFE